MSESTVTLGLGPDRYRDPDLDPPPSLDPDTYDEPFQFDPVAPSDFRLAVEGASKTGKSNTLAVLLEDLADTALPTLIIERLGILSTLRTVDDNLIVVGARDEPGIDLAVPMESVETVAEMVLDRGLKVILDVSTYAGLDDDGHTEHQAVSRVLKALNDNAQARLRTGNRRKCLVVADEVHYLAPENNAPHIELDEYVRRARGQLVTIATEGGNKGLNFIAAYQRRAYASKGVVSQMDNYVIHRLHRTDRAEAAREIGVDEDEIAALGTGEVFVYGDITRQRLRGPVRVRKRRSPDPREESFELPEPPDDLREILDELGEEVAEVQAEREKRRDRIEQLEERVDSLQEENEELRRQVDVEQRMADAFDRIAEGDYEGQGVPADVAAEFEDLQDRGEELARQNDRLQGEVDRLEDELEARDDHIDALEAELSDLRELEAVVDDVATHARGILRAAGEYDIDADDRVAALQEDLDELREENEELREENRRLREQSDRGGENVDGDDLASLIRHDAVRAAVDVAKRNSDRAEEHFDRVLNVLASADGGPLAVDDIVPLMECVGRTTVNQVLRGLFDAGVLRREKDGRSYQYELDRGFLESRIEVADLQEAYNDS